MHHMNVQNKTNALLLAIAKEELEKVVDALLDHNPQLDLQDSVCYWSVVTFCIYTCIYLNVCSMERLHSYMLPR